MFNLHYVKKNVLLIKLYIIISINLWFSTMGERSGTYKGNTTWFFWGGHVSRISALKNTACLINNFTVLSIIFINYSDITLTKNAEIWEHSAVLQQSLLGRHKICIFLCLTAGKFCRYYLQLQSIELSCLPSK